MERSAGGEGTDSWGLSCNQWCKLTLCSHPGLPTLPILLPQASGYNAEYLLILEPPKHLREGMQPLWTKWAGDCGGSVVNRRFAACLSAGPDSSQDWHSWNSGVVALAECAKHRDKHQPHSPRSPCSINISRLWAYQTAGKGDWGWRGATIAWRGLSVHCTQVMSVQQAPHQQISSVLCLRGDYKLKQNPLSALLRIYGLSCEPPCGADRTWVLWRVIQISAAARGHCNIQPKVHWLLH